MSISLADNNGVIGEVATNLGYNDMAESAGDVAKNSAFDELNRFFENGFTKKPSEVANEAMQLAIEASREDIRSTLINLAKLLHKAEGKTIVV